MPCRLAVKIFFTKLLILGLISYTFAHEGEAEGSSEWNPVSAGPLTTWTAPLCGRKKFVVQPFFFYNRTRGAFNKDGHSDSLADGDKKYQYQQQIFMQYGFTKRLEIDAQTVYQENYIKQGELKAQANGLGDSYAFLRYCAIEEKSLLPHISLLFQFKIPSGKYQHADPNKLGTDLMGATSGAGSWDHGYGINLTKKLKPYVLHLDAIYSFPIEVKANGLKTQYGKYLNYDAGIEYFLPKGFNLMLELNGFMQGDKKQDQERIPSSDIGYLILSPGIGWSNNKIQTLLAYQRTVSGVNVDANDSLVVTFVYTF